MTVTGDRWTGVFHFFLGLIIIPSILTNIVTSIFPVQSTAGDLVDFTALAIQIIGTAAGLFLSARLLSHIRNIGDKKRVVWTTLSIFITFSILALVVIVPLDLIFNGVPNLYGALILPLILLTGGIALYYVSMAFFKETKSETALGAQNSVTEKPVENTD